MSDASDSPRPKQFDPANPLGLPNDPLPPAKRRERDRWLAAKGLAHLLDREYGGHPQVQKLRAALDDPEEHRWTATSRGWEAASDAITKALRGHRDIERAWDEASAIEDELHKIADGHQLLALLEMLVDLVPELLRFTKAGFDARCERLP